MNRPLRIAGLGMLVLATAFSLGLISSAPLTRRGIDPVAAGRHIVDAAWVSLVLAGPVAGAFALVGGKVMGVVLGSAYSGSVGRELGHLVVYAAIIYALRSLGLAEAWAYVRGLH